MKKVVFGLGLIFLLYSPTVLADSPLKKAKEDVASVTKQIETKEADLKTAKEVVTRTSQDKTQKEAELKKQEAIFETVSGEYKKLSTKAKEVRESLQKARSGRRDLMDELDNLDTDILKREKALADSWNFVKLKGGLDGFVDFFRNEDRELTQLKKKVQDKNNQLAEKLDTIESKTEADRLAQEDLKKAYRENSQENEAVKKVKDDVDHVVVQLKQSQETVTKLETELKNLQAKKKDADNHLQDVVNNLHKYALDNKATVFTGDEDQALWSKTIDQRDSGDDGLTTHARELRHFLKTKFNIDVVGGYRLGDPEDHGSGKALDFMVDKKTGDKLADYLEVNFEALNVKYIIWQQKFYMDTTNIYGPAYSWNSMPDRGGDTANHMDHVHLSLN